MVKHDLHEETIFDNDSFHDNSCIYSGSVPAVVRTSAAQATGRVTERHPTRLQKFISLVLRETIYFCKRDIKEEIKYVD